MTVTALPAYHCIGSLMFLFVPHNLSKPTTLITGDMGDTAVSSNHLDALRHKIRGCLGLERVVLDRLVLDTTRITDPCHTVRNPAERMRRMAEALGCLWRLSGEAHRRVLICLATYGFSHAELWGSLWERMATTTGCHIEFYAATEILATYAPLRGHPGDAGVRTWADATHWRDPTAWTGSSMTPYTVVLVPKYTMRKRRWQQRISFGDGTLEFLGPSSRPARFESFDDIWVVDTDGWSSTPRSTHRRWHPSGMTRYDWMGIHWVGLDLRCVGLM